VRVTLGKASDFQKMRRGMGFHFDGGDFAFPMLAPMPPMPPMGPMIRGDFDFDFDVDHESIGEAAREAVRAVRVNASAIRSAAAFARADAVRAAVEARAAAYRQGWF
jgi:hypothetical protein